MLAVLVVVLVGLFCTSNHQDRSQLQASITNSCSDAWQNNNRVSGKSKFSPSPASTICLWWAMKINYWDTTSIHRELKSAKKSLRIPNLRSSHVLIDYTRMHIAEVKTSSPSLLQEVSWSKNCLTSEHLNISIARNLYKEFAMPQINL
jgi:hypothetical protein